MESVGTSYFQGKGSGTGSRTANYLRKYGVGWSKIWISLHFNCYNQDGRKPTNDFDRSRAFNVELGYGYHTTAVYNFTEVKKWLIMILRGIDTTIRNLTGGLTSLIDGRSWSFIQSWRSRSRSQSQLFNQLQCYLQKFSIHISSFQSRSRCQRAGKSSQLQMPLTSNHGFWGSELAGEFLSETITFIKCLKSSELENILGFMNRRFGKCKISGCQGIFPTVVVRTVPDGSVWENFGGQG